VLDWHLSPAEQAALTDTGTVDEAEEIEERDGGNDVQIDLQAQSGFGSQIKLHEWAAIPEAIVSFSIDFDEGHR
jgi:hypothetical protein